MEYFDCTKLVSGVLTRCTRWYYSAVCGVPPESRACCADAPYRSQILRPIVTSCPVLPQRLITLKTPSPEAPPLSSSADSTLISVRSAWLRQRQQPHFNCTDPRAPKILASGALPWRPTLLIASRRSCWGGVTHRPPRPSSRALVSPRPSAARAWPRAGSHRHYPATATHSTLAATARKMARWSWWAMPPKA